MSDFQLENQTQNRPLSFPVFSLSDSKMLDFSAIFVLITEEIYYNKDIVSQ